MKFITFTSALFIAMVAGTPLANAGSGLVERDITPEELQLHKRECPEHPVPNPLCPTGAFMCYHADGNTQCVACGQAC
ncbi:hypothetical protein F4820DRAFT_174762 [Hypoxylon rubiginosum]|uniref:Uncharacterized protein n=1 Tax=Hypoxylon rubiginosum TaxID=110542 RepID=A0ACB9YIS0_9PEZI|nr:hypothetical protein F4820DRAFT_174762 [Hypoxylon rubiginosum]